MEKTCFRCGSVLEEQAPFCPSCGAPQIRVAAREPQPEPPESGLAQAEPAAPLSPDSLIQVGLLPGRVHWKRFLRTAWPLALVSGLAIAYYPPVGFLLFLPASVIIALRLYRKHHVGPVRAGQGAAMGAVLAFLSFSVVLVMFFLAYSADGQQMRDTLIRTVNEAAARKGDPRAKEMAQSLLSTNEGIAMLMAVLLFVLLTICTLFASLAGALAAGFGERKDHP